MDDLYRNFRQGSDEFGFLQLTWEANFAQEQILAHKYQLEQANACGKRAWVLFRYDTTHADSIIFSNLNIPSNYGLNQIVAFLNSKLADRSRILKVFLRSKKYASKLYYDITKHLFDCLDGDMKVAKALSGREIFILQLENNLNQPYNLLTNKGMQKLIENIYEPYFQLFSDYFGKTISGIQIEPPAFLDYTKYDARIPWTTELPEFFSQTKKYDLLEYILLLFYDTYNSATVRHDFWQILTELCSSKYVSIIRKWTNSHGIKLAISQPIDSRAFNLNSVILSQNADFLSVHKLEKNPKLEKRRRQILFKQAISSASQQNKDVVLSNPFVLLPFNTSVSLSLQSTSRMNTLISSSKQDTKILVIYPMSSFWVKSNREGSEWILQNLVRIDEMLKGWGYDYDYGDEDLIVKLGKIHKKNKSLSVGQNYYSVIIIPPCITLQESTVKLLRKFISAKGKLIALKPLPYLLKGKVGSDPYPLESLLYHRRTTILPKDYEQTKEQLEKILDKKLKPELKFYLRPNNSRTYVISQHRRKYDRLYLYFLSNSSSEKREILLEFDSEVNLEEWHLEDGSRSQPNQWHANRKTYAELNFEPRQMRILTKEEVGK